MKPRIPDQELRDDEVMQLAQAARANGTPTANPGVVAPIFLGRESDVVPDRYILHYEFVQCRNCGACTRASKFYALTFIRSRINGTRVKHLTPVTSAQFNLPVEKKLTGCSTVPYCQACDNIDLSHLPPPPMESRLYDLAEPRLKGAKPTTTAAPKPAKKPTTLDDLV